MRCPNQHKNLGLSNLKKQSEILSDSTNICTDFNKNDDEYVNENNIINLSENDENKQQFDDNKLKESDFEEELEHPSYSKISIFNKDKNAVQFENVSDNAETLMKLMGLRKHYMDASLQNFNCTTKRYLSPNGKFSEDRQNTVRSHIPNFVDEEFIFEEGVVTVKNARDGSILKCPISYYSFVRDYLDLIKYIENGPLKTFCFRQLNMLQNKFEIHRLENAHLESNELKTSSHKDFYNVMKVDTHIHASSCMNQKHLQRFMKRCLLKFPNEKVLLNRKTGMVETLKEVFESIDIAEDEVTVDRLDVHCDHNTFHRFDTFNSKYNPGGHPVLRDVFLKTDNYISGKYFANVIKEVMRDLEDSKYQCSELRISIYGRCPNEWEKLAKWATSNKVHSHNVKWMVQVPRIYDIFRSTNAIKNFQELMSNIFTPLFKATKDPQNYPELTLFLEDVTGFDSVDDESKPDHFISYSDITPDNWVSENNPPYAYYLFYMYANIAVLNQYRKSKGMSKFNFRPHCGEAGSKFNLGASFLLADNISHGVLLRKSPVMQYLYYLCQVGVAMSPLSNNCLFLKYERNPFYDYFCRGLNVSLSTDDPLQFHFTRDPLMEEYGMACHNWKLTPTDMCELAKNSVMMSGFPDEFKEKWLGETFKSEGVKGNNIQKSNVSNIRVSYRHDILCNELVFLQRKCQLKK